MIFAMFLQLTRSVEKCIDDLTTYEYVNYYYEELAHYDGCENHICELCGLKSWEKSYIRNRVNSIRNINARDTKKANIVKIDYMSPDYILSKSQHCYEPTRNQLLFDYIAPIMIFPSNQSITPINYIGITASYVKIYKREIPILDITDLKMRLSAVIYYMDLLETWYFTERRDVPGPAAPVIFYQFCNVRRDIERDMKYILQSTYVGCSYVIRRNDTHLIDHMICFFSIMQLDLHGEIMNTAKAGPPCSKCDKYIDPFSKRISVVSTYECGKVFVHLCEEPEVVERLNYVNDDFMECPKEGEASKIRNPAVKKRCSSWCSWTLMIILLVIVIILYLLVLYQYFIAPIMETFPFHSERRKLKNKEAISLATRGNK